MTTYAFPGFDTGKRWHIMREYTIDDRDAAYWGTPGQQLISICKTLVIDKPNPDRERSNYEPIVIESDKAPIPFCAHCRRLSE